MASMPYFKEVFGLHFINLRSASPTNSSASKTLLMANIIKIKIDDQVKFANSLGLSVSHMAADLVGPVRVRRHSHHRP